MIHFKPQKLSWPDIWKLTEKFRKKHKFANEFPVNVEALIEFNLGISIAPMPNLKSKADVEAFISKDLSTIYVDSKGFDDPKYRCRHRFTLAEEIGHFILHNDIYSQGVNYTSEEEFISDINNMDVDDLDWVERQAKQFAGRLLVPLDILIDLIEENQHLITMVHDRFSGDGDVEVFAIEGFSKKFCDKFMVSWEVLSYRIQYEIKYGNMKNYFSR